MAAESREWCRSTPATGMLIFNAILLLASALSPLQVSAAQTHQVSQNILKKTPFAVCMDDSDCLKLGEGNKYACFQYICYPWKNDEDVPMEVRRATCRVDSDCPDDMECFRHHDKRNVNRGLCFKEIRDCRSNEECPKNHGCCGEVCCEMEYYQAFADLPCISDIGCQDLRLGKFCCPQRQNETLGVCCDTDPNEQHTTPSPMPASAIGGGGLGLHQRASDTILALLSVTLLLIVSQAHNILAA